MARAVAGGEAGQAADDVDVEAGLGDVEAEEVVGAARREHGVGGRERDQPDLRHAGGRAEHDLLGHAHLEEALRDGGRGRRACRCTWPGRRTGRRSPAAASARRASAWPNGALVGPLSRVGERGDHRRGGGLARRGGRAHRVRPSCELAAGDLPLVRLDAHEVGLLAGLEQRHAAADPGVADEHAPASRGASRSCVERADERRDVVAVDAHGVPAERAPLVRDRLGLQDAGGGAVGLQRVDVDDRGHVLEAVVRAGHRGLPRGALVELAVGEQGVDARRVALVAEAERHPGRHAEPVSERAARDLHAGRVRRHPRHRQARAVAAVGLELGDADHARLGERGVQGDRVVADREQEAVACRPVRVVGPEAQLVLVDHREDVGDAERLADVPLALDLAHVERVAADPGRRLAQPGDAFAGRGVGAGRGRDGGHGRSPLPGLPGLSGCASRR